MSKCMLFNRALTLGVSMKPTHRSQVCSDVKKTTTENKA